MPETGVPGLAMSRSLGDYLAHSVGVSAKPQLIDYVIDLDDEALVIASDGVWEFLSNEHVAQIVHTFYRTQEAELAANTVL